MSRRRAIFAVHPQADAPVMERKPMPGHWKQRVKLAQDMGGDVTTDDAAKAYLKERGYGCS
jgi:hypothetical protein